ncbi:hypothetical protein QTO34_011905 [Cnephaeus nilssonii]|uniref:Immunoglobulin V-set domain-containing protein n=1 Tax=Cnephaeus nilssonii TaxID=3371016 RepID=A0AA40HCH8_CNENI|nr:hypothetical protein QTO34_011905 [Eptesicus nilssonii]
MKRPRTPHCSQEPEEATSCECPHHGLDGASAPAPGAQLRGEFSDCVTQEPSMSVSPGGTVTLTCSLSSGAVSTGNYPGWFQQTPGKPPRQLIYNTNSRPSGVPDRFSGSISGNKAALTISGPSPRTRPSTPVLCIWVVPRIHTAVQAHGEVQPEPLTGQSGRV